MTMMTDSEKVSVAKVIRELAIDIPGGNVEVIRFDSITPTERIPSLGGALIEHRHTGEQWITLELHNHALRRGRREGG